MHSNNSTNPLFEGLEYKDLDGMMKSTIHVDEFASKMGDDADIIVLSFFVRDKTAARDLMAWFEKGYDFVVDADVSPGEITPGRYLVYLEMRRRSAAARHVQQLLDDLSTLTEFEPGDWTFDYEDQEQPWSEEAFEQTVPLTPDAYRSKHEEDLNEMRVAAGLTTKPVHAINKDTRALQAAAGIL
jgi:hypothetical protein